MNIKYLSLIDFRNHAHSEFEFKSNRIIFWGQNGKGKTNILEAISILSMGKSWRENTPSDLISEALDPSSNSSTAKITLKTESDTYECLIFQRSRQFFRNGKKISLKSHLGQIPTLLFCPEYLHIFSGNKKERLSFFDRFLVQIFIPYRDLILRCNRAHIQKTKLLKSETLSGENLRAQIEPWNYIISQTLPQIIQFRLDLIQHINPLLQNIFSQITQTQEKLHLSFEADYLNFLDPHRITDFFTQNFEKESLIQRNLLSPHRGDYVFQLRNKPLTSTASRGETRTVMLALLGAQRAYSQKYKNQNPILLLDDVFSELDADRQKHLHNLCQNATVFFTTTHKSHFSNFLPGFQDFEIDF